MVTESPPPAPEARAGGNALDRVLWVVVPGALLVWVLAAHTRYYFVLDEWLIVDRVVTGPWWRQMLTGINGHLILVPYWLYHLQVQWFGVETSTFIHVVFAISLVALHVSTAAVLVRLGVPTIIALLVAALVTYSGPGAERVVNQFEHVANFALAACFLAAFLALGEGSANRRRAVPVSVLLVVAVAFDSGAAVLGIVFTGIVLLREWPRRLAVTALAAPAAAFLLWTVVDETQVIAPDDCRNCTPVSFPASWGRSVQYAHGLVARAGAGLAGGSRVVGGVVLVVAVVAVGVALYRRWAGRTPTTGFLAGAAGAGAAIVLVTYSRAGFPYWESGDAAVAALDPPSGRYVHPVLLFVVLALAPPLVAMVRRLSNADVRRIVALAASVAVVGLFVVNQDDIRTTRHFYGAWGANTREAIRESMTALEECEEPRDADVVPFEPVIWLGSVGLVQELVERGAVGPGFGLEPGDDVVAAVCADRSSD
jgi:uncharacterized membrane protein YhaH (DUF805 family)